MPDYYSFGNIAFGSMVPDGLIIIPSGEVNYGERHIPFSDQSVLDLGGRSPRHYAARIRATISNYVAIENQVGTTTTLVLGGIEYDNATLVKLDNVRQTPFGEYVLADAEWIL